MWAIMLTSKFCRPSQFQDRIYSEITHARQSVANQTAWLDTLARECSQQVHASHSGTLPNGCLCSPQARDRSKKANAVRAGMANVTVRYNAQQHSHSVCACDFGRMGNHLQAEPRLLPPEAFGVPMQQAVVDEFKETPWALGSNYPWQWVTNMQYAIRHTRYAIRNTQ